MQIALTDLGFLLSSAQNCKKKFPDNLRTITQEENMETRQMTPFCSSTFSALTVCDIHICNSQNSFSCGPPLVRSGL